MRPPDGGTAGAVRYLLIALAGTGAALAALGAANWSLDPYAIYGRGYTSTSDEAANGPLNFHARQHKATRVAVLQPTAVILGTSRAGIGFPASGWPWSQPAYNLSISGGSPREVQRLLEHALGAGSTDRVVVTFDFPMSLKETTEQLPDALLYSGAGAGWGESMRTRIVGPLTLALSHQTLRAACCDARVFGAVPQGRVAPDGLEVPYDKMASRAAAPDTLAYWRGQEVPYARLWRQARERRVPVAHRARYSDELEDLFDALARSGIQAHAAVLPVHPWHLAVMDAAGLWPEYERWLAEIAALGQALPDGIRDYTLIDCAWRADADGSFVDPSHVDPLLGREILADLLGVGARVSCGTAPALLAPATLRMHLDELRERLLEYGARAPAELAAATELAHARVLEPMPEPVPPAWCRYWEKL